MDRENNSSGGYVFGFKCRRTEEHIWVNTGPTTHYGRITDGNRDALEVILEGTVSLVHWVKAAVRSVYLE